jgi:hypothetical protein
MIDPKYQPTLLQNFAPRLSAKIATSGTSQSVTFTLLSKVGEGVFTNPKGAFRTTFKISNKGTAGAYIGWGTGSATAVASSGTPTADCDYVAAGAIMVLDFENASENSQFLVDTIAAIQDAATTTLEISIGFGS